MGWKSLNLQEAECNYFLLVDTIFSQWHDIHVFPSPLAAGTECLGPTGFAGHIGLTCKKTLKHSPYVRGLTTLWWFTLWQSLETPHKDEHPIVLGAVLTSEDGSPCPRRIYLSDWTKQTGGWLGGWSNNKKNRRQQRRGSSQSPVLSFWSLLNAW